MTTLVVHPADRPLAGSVPVPADAGVGLRAILLGALGHGTTRVAGVSRGHPAFAIVPCLRALGVAVDESSPSELAIEGVGLRGLRRPKGAIGCGDSAASMHLLCGVLACQPFPSTLAGRGALADADASPILAPLRARGAVLTGRADREGRVVPPLVAGPVPEGRALGALEYASASADDGAKAAALLSGLYAEGVTIFDEPSVSRDHTERMLCELGVPIRTAGTVVMLDPAGWDGRLASCDTPLPGDLSAAAYLVAAAQLVPGSAIVVRGVGTNPTRAGFLDVARHMGAGLSVEPQGERRGEPVAELRAWSAPLVAVAIGGEALRRAAEDLPAACALAAAAAGTTRLRADGAPAWARPIAAMLRAFGVECEPRQDGLDVRGGPGSIAPADVDCADDPAIAMAASVLALIARGPSLVRGAGCVAARYPKFVATLRALGARVDVRP